MLSVAALPIFPEYAVILLARIFLLLALALQCSLVLAETVVDIPTRPGVTQRFLLLVPEHPVASVILFAGGNGGLQISPDGKLGGGRGNFLIRTRAQWAAQGFVVVALEAPSDRQSEPFLTGFRQTPEHVADIRAVIAWVRGQYALPVWLVGTSRGTQSAAYAATTLPRAEGPDGLVLTSTILTDNKSRSVPAMALDSLQIPTLVVHHRHDDCKVCKPEYLPDLMGRLRGAPRKDLIVVEGGTPEGDPCEARAYHGFNGIEETVVASSGKWMLAAPR
jgi:pimeloyl-ACP methyl ester carboxylesterase